jgi:tyrocidine synthetase-3
MVEAAVASLTAVEQAVVGVRIEPGGDSQLIARYVPTGSDDLTRWRQDLSGRLPAYAMPSGLEAVDAFPLTPSGKIDRRAVRIEISQPRQEAESRAH